MPPEAPARVLQIGLGARGRTWARIVRDSPLAVPAGYVDPRPEAQSWAAAELPSVPFFADLDAALQAVGADLALLVTPPQDRLPVVRVLIERGLPILAEKPLAITLADAAAMVRDAERAGRPLGVVQNFRYMPVSQRLKDLVQSRRYGAPTYATLLYIRNRDGHAPRLNKYPLVMAHPMLLEQSIHHLDLLRFVYGAEVEDVTCMTWNPRGSMYRGDACAAALIRLHSGPVAIYHGTWVSGSNTMEFEWRTDFERGVVVQRSLFGDLAEGALDDVLQPVPLPPTEPFITDSGSLLEDFIQACRGRGSFSSSGRDHLQTLALTLACVESAQAGKRVVLQEFGRRHGLDAMA